MRTQQDVYWRLILEVLFIAPDNEMTAAGVLLAVEERYGDQLNEIDRTPESDSDEEKWKTRARRTSGYMSKAGLLVRPAHGVWRLTPAGLDAVTTPNPPYYGEIPGIRPGKAFTNRMTAYKAGVHPATQAGIVGPEIGVYSICLSDGYSDDEFNGDLITYTGAGGIDQNTKKHIADQELKGRNLGLVRDHENGQPVRVLAKRSVLTKQPGDVDFIYLGLYDVTSWSWGEREGFKILIYQLRAAPGDSLSAANAVKYLERGSDGPPNRRWTVANKIQRNVKITQSVKSLYGDQCQACESKLITAAGPYSEGAHIRPLGAPHYGPDTLSNMLCLCPNCHTMFDGRALWVDPAGMVHIFDQSMRLLTVHTKHRLDFAQLSYHRELCGRGIPTRQSRSV